MFNIASIAFIIIELHILNQRNKKKILCDLLVLLIFVSTNIGMGYFFSVGNSDISYYPAVLYFTIFVCLFFSFYDHKISKRMFNAYLFLIMILIVNYFGGLFFPHKGYFIVSSWDKFTQGDTTVIGMDALSLRLGLYAATIGVLFILIAAQKKLTKYDWMYILHHEVRLSKVVLVMGWIEWFIVNIFRTRVITDLFIKIFGISENQQNALYQRGMFIAAQGVTKEVSEYVTGLFYVCIFMLLYDEFYKNKTKNTKWFWLGCLLILVNSSLSGVIYLVLLLSLKLIFTNSWISNKTERVIILCVAIMAIFIAFIALLQNYQIFLSSNNYIVKRIGRALQQFSAIFMNSQAELLTGSEASRFTGMSYLLQMLKYRWLLGYGLGVLSCMSGIVTMVAGIGILGAIAWFNCVFKLTITYKNDYKYKILFAVFVLILPNLILNDYMAMVKIQPMICVIIFDQFFKREKMIGNTVSYKVRQKEEALLK